MTATTLQQISTHLGSIGAPRNFSAGRTRPASDLDLEVRGVGRLRFPISAKQAKELCWVGRPARYGQGERTLLDRRVRDTWEIPKSRVKIDGRRWNRTLRPVLEELRADLGIPFGRLKATFHSMLVYAPGQFFLPHRDSEKDDEMIATLVVTLPGRFEGGTLVVEHLDHKSTYGGSRKSLSFVAFYADCRHQVLPVEQGYRVVLTYNLSLSVDAAPPEKMDAEAVPPEMFDALAESLCEHFETPLPPRAAWRETDAEPREPPDRLVYLLDHQYTERGLGWRRLKGNDALRTAALRRAAEFCDCEVVLALADVHECWSCLESDGYRPWSSSRYFERNEDEDDLAPADDLEGHELDELMSSEITLTHWVDSPGTEIPIRISVGDDEVCATTPSSKLKAYDSEYEGFMGNYGNTMDRWYRRAAVVLWPRELTFALRSEASPAWAMSTLRADLRRGHLAESRSRAASLLRFWKSTASNEKKRTFVDHALEVAERLDDPELASALLEPFQIDALTPGRAAAFLALVERYGDSWGQDLLAEWTSEKYPHFRKPVAWLDSLPRLCKALYKADPVLGKRWAELLLQTGWEFVHERLESARGSERPGRREKALRSLAKPLLSVLESAEFLALERLREQILSVCVDDAFLPCLRQTLRIAARRKRSPSRSLDVIRKHVVERLKARLEQPQRDPDDWRIDPPEGCGCKLCSTLGEFLADPEARQLEWPIAKERRRHVHQVIESHELPVTHTTRRQGSPYTLVLTKTDDLFEREARKRRSWRADLDRLTRR